MGGIPGHPKGGIDMCCPENPKPGDCVPDMCWGGGNPKPGDCAPDPPIPFGEDGRSPDWDPPPPPCWDIIIACWYAICAAIMACC